VRTILIANPKGGSGKTTIATNLAGYFASRGRHVTLMDTDRQGSAIEWLARRPEKLPTVHPAGKPARAKDAKTEWLIIDSPAGLRGEKLSDAVKQADWVIVPVQPSAYDMGATEDFLAILREEKAIRKQRTFVTLIGTRVNSRAKSAAQLQQYMSATGFPVMGYLRDAQIYTLTAELGVSLFDIRPSQVSKDLQQWAPLLHWLINADKTEVSIDVE
jgi:chromosome partitioning protein